MRQLHRILLLLTATLLPHLALAAGQATDLIALCYHDVREDVRGDMDEDEFAVSTAHLIQHFQWLKDNNYQPVSLDQIEAARSGGQPLPERAVLLTFDDGYASFYQRIFPLLKLYNYPAVFALVTHWLEYNSSQAVPYGNALRRRDEFLHWNQIKEMQASGLVEIASHSNNSHQGILANPQGNSQAALVTRQFFADANRYETEQQYQARITQDLTRSVELIEQHTGKRPRAMVWPYGSYNQQTEQVAKSLGMDYFFTLNGRVNKYPAQQNDVNRILIARNPTLQDFKNILLPDNQPETKRLVHVDIDYVYDENPEQQSRNLDQLVERIYRLKVNTVYLQAFADPDGDGNADALYFPNRHLPMRADLFNRVAWQLRTRANVTVYAWMPVSAFKPRGTTAPERWVWSLASGTPAPSDNSYQRLSIFHPENRQMIKEIYHDLALYSDFGGLLFHDDALLTDFEDVSPSALTAYRKNGLLFTNPQQLRDDPSLRQQWTRLKSQALVEFTQELAGEVRNLRPLIKTARNIYALPILNPNSEQWFAQNLEDFLAAYDYTAVMAMPYMEGETKPGKAKKWLRKLVKTLPPEQLSKLVFELQSVDWHKQQPIPAKELAAQMKLLARHGVTHFGYYPDNFIQNQPALTDIKAALSLEDYLYAK
ncbi:poly-beta-1,6-N-acetyl-D-glucosamine N-deacetylase PgaB [Halioxenophilus aromaticivorans]|uniref:Poly-beta-1,6-N-acetyl-D-glucosamine N-deacetylase PgaB n=1 Tax=Halioxenophilus aromaticivorans TaxID=1306992 RepID=A0AAV3U4T9_9ALTE